MPRHIPQSLEVEISELGIGDSIFVKDLEFENIKFITPEDAVIVSVTAPKAEVEETTEDVTEEGTAEPEVISKGKSEEE
jgi:large subunit ribosomal protein L25